MIAVGGHAEDLVRPCTAAIGDIDYEQIDTCDLHDSTCRPGMPSFSVV
jgi:hypothetical protein